MSVSFYSNVSLGLMVSKDELVDAFKPHIPRKPGCSHHPLPRGALFCSVCGEPGFKEEKYPDEITQEIIEKMGFTYKTTTDRDYIIIGKVLCESEDMTYATEPQRINIISTVEENALRTKLKQKLQKYNLYDINKFGYWLVPYCSY